VEHVTQQEVVLEAVPPAPLAYELALERRRVQARRPAEQRIQILERDRLRVQAMDGPQRGERRRPLAVVPDPREVRVEVDHAIFAFTCIILSYRSEES